MDNQVFGQSQMPGQPSGSEGPENMAGQALGIQAPQSGQNQGQFQQQGQPQNQQAPIQGQPPVTEAPGTPQNSVVGQPVAQNQAPVKQGQPENVEITEEKINNIRQKFDGDRQKVIEGLANLAQRMGHQLDTSKVQQLPDEELYKAYAIDEQELGRIRQQQGQNQVPSQELEEMKSQLRAYEQYIANMMNGFSMPGYSPQNNINQPGMPYGQQGQAQLRDPQNGQFMSQEQAQQIQQGQNPGFELELDDFDYDKMLEDESYMKKYMQNQLQKNLSKVTQTVQEQFRQEQAAERQKQAAAIQQRRQIQNWQSQVKQLETNYGKDTFNKYRQAAGLKVQQKPWLSTMPNGFEIAFKEAMSEGLEKEGQYNQQQQNIALYNQQINTLKQNARMPQSTAHTPGIQQDPTKAYLDAQFGGTYAPDRPFG